MARTYRARDTDEHHGTRANLDSTGLERRNLSIPAAIVVIATLTFGLYLLQSRNYLVFHGLVEMFSVAIAWGIFAVARSGQRYHEREYMSVLGVAYGAVGLLDLLHTLGYTGMGVFRDYDFYANQLWVAARYLESISLLVATLTLGRRRRPRFTRLALIYSAITAALIYSIFFSDVFPAGYVAGEGQTTFKIVSEYIINAILIATLMVTIHYKDSLAPRLRSLVIASIAITIVAEVAFTFYVDNYGISNMIGHYAKLVSFYLLYRAVIVTSIDDPYDAVFDELTRRTTDLADLDALNKRVFSIVSHDLRGTFATLTSYCRLLNGPDPELDERDRTTLAADHERAVNQGAELVENLLRWARSEQEGVNVQPAVADVRDLVVISVDAYRSTISLKDLTVDLDALPPVTACCDPDTVGIIVRNLLSNAVKFSYRGGTVEFVGEANDTTVSVRVIDHGVGMSQPGQGTRGASTRGTAGERGTGLGLSIVRRFVAANRGTVSFGETPGGGTTATIVLPRECDDAPFSASTGIAT